MKFNSQLNTSGRETLDLWHTGQSLYRHTHRWAKKYCHYWNLSFLTQYPLRLASISTKQPTSYTHTWTDTLIMKYQRRNSATRGQDCPHTMYTPEPLWNLIHNWTLLGAKPSTCETPVSHSIDIPTEELKRIAIIGTLASSHNTRSDLQAYRQSNEHHIHTHEQTHW